MTAEQNKLIEDNIKLIPYTYNIYYNCSMNSKEKDEIMDEGMFGLIRAVQTYDASKGTTFANWAIKNIRGAKSAYINKYVSKTSQYTSIEEIIENASDDNYDFEYMVMPSDQSTNLSIEDLPNANKLTKAEYVCLTLTAWGYKQRECAKFAHCSAEAVCLHLKKAYAVIKTGIPTRQSRGAVYDHTRWEDLYSRIKELEKTL